MLARLFISVSITILLGWYDAVLAATPPAAAQNITVSPTQLPLEVAPGQSVSGQVTVINDGGTTYDFKAYAKPYRVAGETYDQQFETLPGQPDASRWIVLGSGTYHLVPHQSMVVPYTLKVPAGTKAGGYYGALFYETIPQLTGGSGVESKTRVGVVAYIKVSGLVAERGQVESFTAPWWQSQAPLQSTLRLSNSGNVHYPADIRIVVSDMLGYPKASIHVAREVLPDTIRRFDLRWEAAPPFGLFRVGGTASFLGRTEALPARYVLIMTPLVGVAVVVVMSLLIVGLWLWRRRRRKAER